MNFHSMTDSIGAIAAIIGTITFAPQVWKVWKQGGRDLSYLMLLLYFAAVVLWSIYGGLTHSIPLVVANLAIAALVGLTAILKWSFERRRHRPKLRIAIDIKLLLPLGNSDHTVDFSKSEIAGVFADTPSTAGSSTALKELCERYEIFIVCSTAEYVGGCSAIYDWVQHQFPWVLNERMVFCGERSVLDVDYLLDDTVKHFRSLRGTGLLFGPSADNVDGRKFHITTWSEVFELIRFLDEGGKTP